MNVRRILVLSVAAGAIAAWWAAASTTARRPIAAPGRRAAAPVEMQGAELAAEIARLRERLRPTTAPQAPARNLFEFSRRAAPRGAAAVEAPRSVEMSEAGPPAIEPPSLRLVGIAEDEIADGVVRTAIVSAAGQLIFAKPGDAVTERYRVVAISGEAAELTDLLDHSTLTLVLR